MAKTGKTSEETNKKEKIDRRRIRKIQSPAKAGRIKRSLIEKAVKEVIAERALQ
jgi:serine kinase of HPr protein (carbohydrate metabolism regulator)